MSALMRPAPPTTSLPAPVFPRAPRNARPLATPTTRARAPFTGSDWTTPRVLQACLLASLLLVVLLFVAGFNLYMVLRQSVQSVGRDSVPSILAAQQIRASLVDMDASAANDLLAGASGSRIARESYDAERSLIGRQLVTAAQDITYGNLERIPIETLQDGMTVYTGLIAQARQQSRDGNGDAARATFTQASTYLHATLVPAVQRLDAVNSAYLDRAYRDAGTASGWATALAAFAGPLLFVALVGAQLFLSRRTRRTLNLPLLAATVMLALFFINLIGTALVVNANLKTAKQDAFASIAALANARALVYDANGNQTVALLDPANAMRYRGQFDQQTNQIVDRPITDAMVSEAQNVATKHADTPQISTRVSFGGELANEINNVTFGQPEADAAMGAVREFQGYQMADAQIRALADMGQLDQARALATGTNTDQAHRAFERFDAALVRAINVSEGAFDGAVTRAFANAAPLQWQSPVAALLIGLLAFLGLQPRLREYAV